MKNCHAFVLFIATVLVLSGCSRPQGEGGEVSRELVLVEKRTVLLGQFDVVTGSIVATDPGYDISAARMPGLGTVVERCATGHWTASVVLKRFEGSDWLMPSEVVACHGDLQDWGSLCWREIDKGLGADTGQVGIWDLAHFHDHSIVPKDVKWSFGTKSAPGPADPDDLWYSWCCEMTNQHPGASLMPYGVVSRSGYGDGGYPVFVALDANDRVIAILVRFIDDQGRG